MTPSPGFPSLERLSWRASSTGPAGDHQGEPANDRRLIAAGSRQDLRIASISISEGDAAFGPRSWRRPDLVGCLAGARRDLRRRAARAACPQPGCRAAGDSGAPCRPLAAAAAGRQRQGPSRRLPRQRPRGGGRAARGAGGRMAARQLPPRRGADPRDPRRPAARLLPPAPQARRRSVRRLSAGVRAGVGLRRPHRQPLRSRDAAPLPHWPTSRCSPSPSASSGRWRSRCASCWSRTCGASPTRSPLGQAARAEADALADAAIAGRRARRGPRGAIHRLRRRPLGGALRRPARQAAARPGPAHHALLVWLETG